MLTKIFVRFIKHDDFYTLLVQIPLFSISTDYNRFEQMHAFSPCIVNIDSQQNILKTR